MKIRFWRILLEFPGYKISDDGKIESCRDNSGKTTNKWHRMKPERDKDGYLRVSLRKNKISIRKYVHTLVLQTFRGECPIGMEACHENGIPDDNRINNLRWETPQNNQRDRIRHGTHSRGEKNGTATITDNDARKIKKLRQMGHKLTTIAAKFHTTIYTVSRIGLGKLWKHI